MPHPKYVNRLLKKLYSLKLNNFLLRWISDYLTDRKQSVVLGGAQSSVLPVISGVPQGSILGPLLFIIFIGVSTEVSSSKLTIYVDDIALYKIFGTNNSPTAT